MKAHHFGSDLPETKRKIYTAAAELFSKHGYHSVSVREICDAAGVTKPALYYYFKDKDALILELFKESHDKADQLFESFMDEKDGFMEMLSGLFNAYKNFLTGYPDYVRFFTLFIFMSIPEEVRKMKIERSVNNFKNLTRIFMKGKEQGFIEQNTDIEMLVTSFTGSFNQITLRYIILPEEDFNIEENLERLFNYWKDFFYSKKNSGDTTNEN